jgi:hypothetical protein
MINREHRLSLRRQAELLRLSRGSLYTILVRSLLPTLAIISRITGAVIGMQIHLLVLDRTPEPHDEDVVAPGPSAIHADGYLVVGQQPRERGAGELAPLVGIEDLRPAVSGKCIVDGINAKIGLQAD